MRCFLTFVIVLILLPNTYFLFAHGSGGTIEVLKDGYLIDIGYTPKNLEADTQIRFDFLLYDQKGEDEKGFSDLWVRIEKEEALLFAGAVAKPTPGEAGFSYRFLEEGVYSLFVRYRDQSQTLVETQVDLKIKQGDLYQPTDSYSGKALVFVAILSFTCAAFLFGVTKRIYILFKNTKILSLKVPFTNKFYSTIQKNVKSIISQISLQDSLGSVGYVFIGILVSVGTFIFVSFLLGSLTPSSVGITLDQTRELYQQEKNTEVVTVVLTEEGYVPNELTIPLGTVVEFSTTIDRPHWPASNLHPSHGIYPEFDPMKPVASQNTWQFTFDKSGDWKFHDHIRSYYTGIIHVQ
ncbi:MAG: hypothetical protein ACI92I_000453 [Acidimicrobiales bacterium]|jgi:hypothetical protein